jgi:beta-lactamase regulating signal transducer with metallopeptidase domain
MTGTLLDLAVRSSVLLAAGGAVAFALRRRAASVQALVLTTALAGSLVLPAAMWLSPAVEVEVPGAAGLTTSAGASLTPAGMPSQRPERRPSRPLDEPDGAAPAGASASTSGRAADPAASSVPLASMPLAGYAALAWLLGLGIAGARLAGGHIRLARIVRSAEHAGGGWPAVVSAVSRELGLRRRVEVRVSAEVSVPIVSGVISPAVILPIDADEWPIDVARDVLRHELAHVVRADGTGHLAGRLACALYWFNPLAWMLASRAALLRERACDDEVLRAGTRSSDYASRLLALVRPERDDATPASALAMATSSRLHERIVRVLDPSVRRARVSRSATSIMMIGGFAVVAGVGALQPVARAEAVVLPAPFGLPPGPPVAAPAPAESPQPAVTRAAIPAEAQAQAQPAPALCAGRIDRSSSSTTIDDGVRRWRVEISGDRCDIDLRVEGRVDFNEDFTDVASLDRGGLFRVDATTDGTRRQLEIRNRGGSLERTYQVEGRTAQWDAEARAWLAGFLVALDRRTAIGVDVRLPTLLRQGGVDAVLAETALVTSDHARARYYGALLDARQLSPAERRQLIEQAASLIESDHYASETLRHVVAQGRIEDTRERDAVVSMLVNMDSDHYRTEAVRALRGGPITSEQAAAIRDVMLRMDSDHYRTETLTWLASQAPAALDLTMMAAAIREMDSDHYRTESVKVISRRGLSADQAAALLALVGDMESAHYQGEVLDELLRVRLPDAALVTAVELIQRMDSDHYQAEALRAVLGNAGVTGRVREAVRTAAGALSRPYRDEVLRRIGG